VKPLVKFEIVLATVSFGLIFVAGVAGRLAVKAGHDPKAVDPIVHASILLLFCFFGFSCIGLMLHAFLAMQVGIGNANEPMIRYLSLHETRVILAVWGFLGLGTLVAMPFALESIGIQLPLRSQGLLTADIGMTLDDVKARSTIKIPPLSQTYDGSGRAVEKIVFEFRIGDSAIHFPQSRYYWLETTKNNPRISILNIGITPRKLPKSELEAFIHATQSQLFADGWMPGHYVADSEQTIHMWGGKRTSQDGRYWLRGNTVFSFERKRMDEETRDETPDSGEYIVDIHLEAKGVNRDLVFEPSAWSPSPR
jgi:hypothetical protein